MTRALSVYLPKWAVRLAVRRRNRPRNPDTHRDRRGRREAEAVLLIATDHGKQVVACCCARSESAGVRVGMDLAHARALLRQCDVCVEPFTPERDEAALVRLARWAVRFAPTVSPDPPDGLLLDIFGCAHLFGGEASMAETIVASLARLGFAARIGVAETFGCAAAVARCGASEVTIVPADRTRQALQPLPVAALRIDERIRAALAEVGVERIGALLELPRGALASRFGGDLLRRLDEAIGASPRRLQSVKPCKTFAASCVYEAPVTAAQTVRHAVRTLLETLLADLDKHHRGLATLFIELRRIDAEPTHVSLALTRPTLNLAHLWSLLEPRLERVNVGFGVEEIHITAARTGRVVHEQGTLGADWLGTPPPDSSALGEMLDRLVDRLGAGAVARLVPVESHVPERAFRRLAATGETDRSTPCAMVCASRPLRLFNVPEPARVIAVVPDGPPGWIAWRGRRCDIISSFGPERIAFPWWEDGRAATRDYYVVQDENGRWLWLYRDDESRQWFVHGEWV